MIARRYVQPALFTVDAATKPTNSDMAQALAVFRVLCPKSPRFSYLVIPGAPPSKARARVGKGGRIYSPDRSAERVTAGHLRDAFPEPLDGNLAIGCVFYRPNRQRIDADNMLKHVLDAATSIIWHDDSQVTAILGIVEYDQAQPRTIVVVGAHESSLRRERVLPRTCATCGNEFDPKGRATARFCSPACNARSRGQNLSGLIACPTCEQPFRRKVATQKFCSVLCAAAPRKGRKRPDGKAANCVDCGASLARRTATRCRSCWKAARTKGIA